MSEKLKLKVVTVVRDGYRRLGLGVKDVNVVKGAARASEADPATTGA